MTMRNLAVPPPPGDDVRVRGALGTLRERHLAAGSRPRWLVRAFAFLVIMGPGVIVMIGDNDAGGVTTYAQAGQAFGYSLLWVFPVLLVVLYVAQEMAGRLGAVTGAGHGRLLRERFGRFWAAFSVLDLFVLNFLTLVTEFIGIDLGFAYFGVPGTISVPVMALALTAIVLGRQFRRWERLVLVMIAVSMLMLALPFITGGVRSADWAAAARSLVIPGVRGGLSATAMIFIIGVVGTTIAPWQLFFQQGSVVDKAIGTRFTSYERADTLIGSVFTNVQGAALVIVGALAFGGTKLAGGQSDALSLARGMARFVTPALGTAFAIVLLNAAMIGAATVTLSSSYAIGDLFTVASSLNSRFRDAKGFYLSYVASIAAAAGVVLIPRLPLGVISLGVQVLAGVLLPSALGFLVLLCNDRELLGPWVNSPWLNTLATLIVALLLELSLVLTVATIWPSVNAALIAALLAIPVLAAAGGVGITQRKANGRWRADPAELARRGDWVTPPEVLTRRLPKSRGRDLALGVMRAYLLAAVALMVVSIAQLAR
jgi:Mn2+/Fe2+ NRAMP family transporter